MPISIGEQYNDLEVVSCSKSDDSLGSMWLCQCRCGGMVDVPGKWLLNGYAENCGCTALVALISNYKRHAERRGYEWALSREQFLDLTKKLCHYCGVLPGQVFPKSEKSRVRSKYIYNGLDRIDNEQGYTIDNVVPCCGICNRAKSTMSEMEFRRWVCRAFHHLYL